MFFRLTWSRSYACLAREGREELQRVRETRECRPESVAGGGQKSPRHLWNHQTLPSPLGYSLPPHWPSALGSHEDHVTSTEGKSGFILTGSHPLFSPGMSHQLQPRKELLYSVGTTLVLGWSTGGGQGRASGCHLALLGPHCGDIKRRHMHGKTFDPQSLRILS